jgi:hypothetical protein
LLAAVFEAAGFEDARVWFLTGHTVTEVFYDGAYHYFDSDMMGYSTVGKGDPKKLPVASVSQVAANASILLGKLLAPNRVDPTSVEPPWYPADVRESAVAGLAELFTTRNDNWLFPFTRFSRGHSMDFVLRPGEKITRYYQPESRGAFYLPYSFDGVKWQEFPKEIGQYDIRTEDGPRSQKDTRTWATGQIEYRPPLRDWSASSQRGQATFELRSPYVLIDATISLNAALSGPQHVLEVEISLDEGKTWEVIGSRHGPFSGEWELTPKPRKQSPHGTLSPVAGKYGYLVRLRMSVSGTAQDLEVKDVRIASRVQVNPRALPELRAGKNELDYAAGAAEFRREVVPPLERLAEFALQRRNLRCVTESGQSFLWPEAAPGWAVFELAAPDGADLAGFDAGARFLDLRDGLAPDKLTAEVRRTSFAPASRSAAREPRGTLSWSTSPEGPFTVLWRYDPNPKWKDGQTVPQLLRWPEVDRSVRNLPAGTRRVYVRYSVWDVGLDSLRLAAISRQKKAPSALEITHQWIADGLLREHIERIENAAVARSYTVDTGKPTSFRNHALILSCP